jgi:transcription initiation factor IIE alpha subunit
MAITVKDLEKNQNTSAVLHCPCCGFDYSATAGDYFWMPRDEVFTCEECEEELILAVKSTLYNQVKT